MLQNDPSRREIPFEEAYATARDALGRIETHNRSNPPVRKVVLDTQVLRALLAGIERRRA